MFWKESRSECILMIVLMVFPQLLELRLFMVQLNLTFFFAPISEAQSSFESYETITRRPKRSLIRPVSWDSPEALAALAK